MAPYYVTRNFLNFVFYENRKLFFINLVKYFSIYVNPVKIGRPKGA